MKTTYLVRMRNSCLQKFNYLDLQIYARKAFFYCCKFSPKSLTSEVEEPDTDDISGFVEIWICIRTDRLAA